MVPFKQQRVSFPLSYLIRWAWASISLFRIFLCLDLCTDFFLRRGVVVCCDFGRLCFDMEFLLRFCGSGLLLGRREWVGALRLDGAEIFSSSYFDRWQARCDAEREMTAAGDTADLWRRSWEKATENGGFDQKTFYRAFAVFDSQSVAESLASENAVVRMLALLDRRTGKRTLKKLRAPMQQAPQWLQMIYFIRLEAEHMPLSIERKPMKKGILFDLDGTLWDSSAECTQAWNKCIREQTDRTEQFTLADMHHFMGRQMGAIAALMFPTLPEAERLRILDLCTDSEHVYLRFSVAVV